MEDLFNIVIRTFGGYRKKNHDSGQISVDCPNCDDGNHKGNLEIHIFNDVYSCWACRELPDGVKGRDIRWLIRKYGTSDDFQYYNELRPKSPKLYERPQRDVILPYEYKTFTKINEKSSGYKIALKYLSDRGISKEIIDKFNIGFCDSGYYEGRIIIPSFNRNGFLDYFVSRDYTGTSKEKYLNHTNDKSNIIFNEYFIEWDMSIILVEGVFDHIITINSIALLGKTVSPKLSSILQKNLNGNLYILFDEDAIDNAEELKKQLNFGALRNRVYIIKLPKGEDPSSLFQKLGKKEYYKALSNYIVR
jgi:hypothetical protein